MRTTVNLFNAVEFSSLETNLRKTLINPLSRKRGKIIISREANRNYSARGNILLVIVLYPLN